MAERRNNRTPEEKVFLMWLQLTGEQRRSFNLMVAGNQWEKNALEQVIPKRKRAPRAQPVQPPPPSQEQAQAKPQTN